jgi:hypothetical protein
MPSNLPAVLLLSFCWIASLVILLLFLESWFGVSEKTRFVARRASGAYGICSVFLPMRGTVEEISSTVRSIFGQSYPFIELFLIYPDEDAELAALAKELRSERTHVAVRLVPVPQALGSSVDRIRALERAQGYARGRWYVVLDKGIVLDPFALEASLEFAGTGEIRALSLRPGTQAASRTYRLLAPSIEYLSQMMRVIERRRVARPRQMNLDAPFLLLNREAFEVVHRINRMPGILNEAGWTAWSYQMEGLRTFDGDGSRWLWREIGFGSWPDFGELDTRTARRAPGLIAAALMASLIPVAGLAYGFYVPATTFLEAMILALSSVSYALMAISYFLYARRLHAAAWFAPFWFVVQPAAALMTLAGIRRMREAKSGAPAAAHKQKASPRTVRFGRGKVRRITRG